MATVERILIGGGGIAGLTVATALHQQGFSLELVERSPEWPTVGTGIALQANGLRVAVEQAGTVLRRWAWCDQQGEVRCDTNLVDRWAEVGPCVGIARPALQQVLLAGAAAVLCRFGTAVTALTQEQQRVQVGFSYGSSGEYDLVVGADGLESSVRQLVLGTASIGQSGAMMWRSLVPTRPPGVTGTLTILLGEGCLFGQVPVGAGHTYGFGYVNEPRIHDLLEGRRERLRQRFAAFGGPVPAYLAALTCDEQTQCAPIEWVGDVAQWHRGRVVLIGDAAHEMELLRPAPQWPARVAAVRTVLREMLWTNAYVYDPARFSSMAIPTLLLLGEESPAFLQAGTQAVHAALLTSRLHVMPGQQHTAMNTAPQLFTREVLAFLAQAD